MNEELVTITEEASHVLGTSAELVPGDMLTLQQLMHGLMLPSGNDASYALAAYFGEILLPKKEQFDTIYNIDEPAEEAKDGAVEFDSEPQVNDDLIYFFGPLSTDN